MKRSASPLVLLCTVSFASARILFLDNNPLHPYAFTTAQIAHDSANTDDTIYCIGSGTNYGSLTTTKRLYWYGPGIC